MTEYQDPGWEIYAVIVFILGFMLMIMLGPWW
jgi:hypothetical protein